MFEELNTHRQAVRENIEKAFEVGFTGNNDLEKAHQVGDIHPNGKWVWTQLPSGKFDWRVIKRTSTPSSGSTPVTAQKKESNVNTLKLESKNGFKFKSNSNYRMRYNKREKAYEIWKEGDVYGIKTAMMSIKSDNENIGGDIIKYIQKKYPKTGSTISYSAVTYGF